MNDGSTQIALPPGRRSREGWISDVVYDGDPFMSAYGQTSNDVSPFE
jgi:hypothetical protein